MADAISTINLKDSQGNYQPFSFIGAIHYGYCDTAAHQPLKTAYFSKFSPTQFDTITEGTMLAVRFIYGNSVDIYRLIINNTQNSVVTPNGVSPVILSNDIAYFVWNGTAWNMLLAPVPQVLYGTCSTEAEVVDKIVDVSGLRYDNNIGIPAGTVLIVRFTNSSPTTYNYLRLGVRSGSYTSGLTGLSVSSLNDNKKAWGAGDIRTFVKVDFGANNYEWVDIDDTSAALRDLDSRIPTKVSDLTNDSGYLTLSTLPVWNGSVTP